jgi:adenylate kinase
VNQAEKLDEILYQLTIPLDSVVNIDVPLEELIERLSGRLTCKKCNAIYHVQYNPPEREGICDQCGGELLQRSDDTEAAITQRFEAYTEQTSPLICYYQEKGLLTTVNGRGTIEEVAAAIETEVL